MREDADVEEIKVLSFSMVALYSTLEDLTEDADAVVLGTVEEITQIGISRGMEGDGSSIPYTLYEVGVLETIKGDVGQTIYVSRTDPAFLADTVSFGKAPLTRLNVGETVVLYLHEISADIEPTITLTGTIYVPLSFDNGVFDVAGEGPAGAVGRVNDTAEILPRGIHYDMFTDGDTFTAADVRQAVGLDPG